MEQGHARVGGGPFGGREQRAAEALSTAVPVDHQLDDLGPVTAVGLVREDETDRADHPVTLARHPHGETACRHRAHALLPPGDGRRPVERGEEADRGTTVHGVDQQVRQLLDEESWR